MKAWLFYPMIRNMRKAAARSRAQRHPTGEPLVAGQGTKDEAEALLYRPESLSGPLPVIFLVHGGSWIFGSAPGCEDQSRYLSDLFGAVVVSVDYTLLYDAPFPRQQKQTAAVVRHVLDNAESYGVDLARAYLMGFSAGAHISAGADILLRGEGRTLRQVFLCYPFLDFVGFSLSAYTESKGKQKFLVDKGADALFFSELPKNSLLVSPGNADFSLLKGLSPTVLLSCGDGDLLKPQAESYYQKLLKAGNRALYRDFPKARHGFLEVNFPDHKRPTFAQNDEQKALMEEAYAWMKSVWDV